MLKRLAGVMMVKRSPACRARVGEQSILLYTSLTGTLETPSQAGRVKPYIVPGLKVHFARLHPEWAVYGIFTPGWINMSSQMVPIGETQDGKEVIFLPTSATFICLDRSNTHVTNNIRHSVLDIQATMVVGRYLWSLGMVESSHASNN